MRWENMPDLSKSVPAAHPPAPAACCRLLDRELPDGYDLDVDRDWPEAAALKVEFVGLRNYNQISYLGTLVGHYR
jgi:hypothetical protein